MEQPIEPGREYRAELRERIARGSLSITPAQAFGRVLVGLAVAVSLWTVILNLWSDVGDVLNWTGWWAGLDLAEAAALALTGIALTKGSRLTLPLGVIGAALLLADAWLDIATADPGSDLGIAVGMALFAEVPLAFALAAVAVRARRYRAIPWPANQDARLCARASTDAEPGNRL